MKNEIYIGENLKVMQSIDFNEKINSIDTIYIDPPYNTNSTFSYKDSQNHSEWLQFMKDRLTISKNLLKDTGVIFISVDDNEYAYLKVLCDDIYGINNFLGSFITRQAQRSNSKYINITHEYILCYAKYKNKVKPFKIKRIEIPEEREIIENLSKSVKENLVENGINIAQKELNKLIKKYCEDKHITWLKNYCSIDEEGNIYFGKDLSMPSPPNSLEIPEIGLKLDPLPTRGWASADKFKELYSEGRLVYKNGRPYEKQYLYEAEDNASSVLNFYSRQGTNDLNKLGLKDLFDTPKPVGLIKYLIKISTPKNGTILDYFAGSGTTAQAIYELNEENNYNYNYILVQDKVKVDDTTKVFKACDIYGIEPYISAILIHRINTYLSISKKDIDYELKVLDI